MISRTPTLLVFCWLVIWVTLGINRSGANPIDASPHRPDTSSCLVGPSFWCKSSQNSKLCRAEGFCANSRSRDSRRTPGEELLDKAKLRSENICARCLNISKDVISALNAKEATRSGVGSPVEIRGVAIFCGRLSSPARENLCASPTRLQAIVDVILAQARTLLPPSPHDICGAFKFCSADFKGKDWVRNELECEACQLSMEVLKSFAKEARRREIMSRIDQYFCDKNFGPPLNEYCNNFFQNITKAVWDVINKPTIQQVCEGAGFCWPNSPRNPCPECGGTEGPMMSSVATDDNMEIVKDFLNVFVFQQRKDCQQMLDGMIAAN